jgi:putative aldouronate transport system permease protein
LRIKVNERLAWAMLSHGVMLIAAALALFPFILLIVASFTDNATAAANGYSLFPAKLSLEAYNYIGREWRTIGRSYFMTVVVTILGTVLSLLITTLYAYAISKRNLPGVNLLTFICIFTMLFNGGIVSSYFVYTTIFHIRNTIWALIVPNLLMNAFSVILVKNYFQTSISPSIIEAAQIDGSSETGIFAKIALPLSLPILATIGLMSAITYWNDWTNGLYYLTDRGGSQYYTIQLILNRINENVNFLASNQGAISSMNMSNLPSATMRMAIAAIGILPIMAAYPFFQKYFVKGISLGGVKE